jgi:hypothetical protein
MRFDDALKQLDGQSVGGQLIVQVGGVNVLVGRHHDGQLIVDDTDQARAIVEALTEKPDEAANAQAEGRKARGKAKPQAAGADTVVGAAEQPVAGAEGADAEPTAHAVVVADEVVTAEQVGGAG